MTLQYVDKCMRGNGERYCRDLKVVGNQISENWWRKQGHHVDAEDIIDILAAKPEILVVGAGYAGFMEVSNSLRSELKTRGILLIAQPTPQAVETFNQLHSKGRKVAGAFHLTC